MRKKVIYGRLGIKQLSCRIVSESSSGFNHKRRRDGNREIFDLGAESPHQVSLLPSLQTQKASSQLFVRGQELIRPAGSWSGVTSQQQFKW